jgi:hypothetical protein
MSGMTMSWSRKNDSMTLSRATPRSAAGMTLARRTKASRRFGSPARLRSRMAAQPAATSSRTSRQK